MRVQRLILAGVLLAPCVVRAQTPASSSDSSAQPAAPANAPWVTRRDFVDLGIAAGATVALAPLDRSISAEFAEPHWEDSRRVRRVTANVAFFGGDGPVVLSSVLYLGSTVLHADAIERAALHNIEAIVLAAGVTGIAKGVFGRALPGVHAAHSFSFGRGFHDDNGPFVSFPSGHTSAAFAMAVTLTGEIGEARPDLASRLQPLLLAGAGAVGVARVIQRVHWPSDLPLAVVIGMWSGRVVESHTHRSGVVSSALRGLTIAPGEGGRELVGWSCEVAFGDR